MTRFIHKATLCSTLAIATSLVVGARPAAAQSFIGTVISEVGAHAHTLGNGQTQINVTQSQAVINWTATGASNNGVITFQAAGTTAEFQGNNSFAVLNRIYPGVSGSSILLDGNIFTSVNGNSGGGTIFFYSPNGVVIGQHAVIDVGSLGLTTLQIADDGEGNWLTGFGSATKTIDFGPALNSGSFVRIDNGASVKVGGSSGFIALLAPKVDLEGTINTDGVAALVAAEQATLTIRDNGLWDIQIGTGTADPNGIVVNGTIARNSATIGGNRTAYLVAVSKNDAMTMLFNGSSHLGFDIAGSAGVEGNSVVLSAGTGVTGGVADAPASSGGSAITLDGASITSKLYATANGAINVNSDSGASLFSYDASFVSADQVNITASANDVTFAKKLTVNTDRHAPNGANAAAGSIQLSALNGHTLQVNERALLSATGYGGSSGSPAIAAGTGTGGHIVLQAGNGGHLNFTGNVFANADGYGGDKSGSGGSGGSGVGGQIDMLVSGNNSQVNVGNNARLFADGYGGNNSSCTSCNVIGGQGFGGLVNVYGSGGTGKSMTIQNLWIEAQGIGGLGDASGGAGTGGQTHVTLSNGTTLTVNNSYYNFADGIGGAGIGSGNGGAAFGGTAGVASDGTGGTITYNGTGTRYFYVTAEGFGGAAGPSGGNGGAATGGTATINSNALTLNSAGQIYVSAYGLGGNAVAGTGGSGQGGHATISGAGAVTGGQGGWIRSFGQGGNGLSGGNGIGGEARISLSGGSLTTNGGLLLDAYGQGGTASGAGGIGGNGTGGTAQIQGTAGNGNFNAAVTVNGYAVGGNAVNGTGGNATGGFALLQSDGAAFHATSTLSMVNGSTGGNGMTGGNAIALTPTVATNILDANGGGTVLIDGATLLNSNSTGGNGSTGNGGSARAGAALVTVGNRSSNGTVTLAGLTINANAIGGSGGSNGGAGGNTTGGRALVRTSDTASGINRIVTGAASLNATALGGSGGTGAAGAVGGNGGNANGGRAFARATAGNGQLVMQAVAANISATGGSGGTGGTGSLGGTGGAGGSAGGGAISIGMIPGTGSPTSAASAQFGSITATANLTGGNGGNGGVSYSVANGNGGRGGYTGTNFSELIADSGAVTVTGNASFTANSSGGNGGGGGTINGAGGNALTNDILVTARRAAVLPGSPPLLTVGGAVTVSSTASGGNGSTRGISLASGGTGVFAENADMHLGSFTATIASSDGNDPASNPDLTQIINGTVTIDGGYSVSDSNRYAVHIDNGALNAGSVSLSAFNFVFDVLVPMAVNRGTITAGTININSQNDIILDANLVSLGYLDLWASGLINLGDLNADGYISIFAGGSVTLGDLLSGYYTDIFAGGDITTGDIESGDEMHVDSNDGNVTLGNLDAAGKIHLRAGDSILVGDAIAGDKIDFDAFGTMTGGNFTAGRQIGGNGDAGVVLGNLSVGSAGYPEQGFSVGISSASSIIVGDVNAAYSIGFADLGPLTTGTLTAGNDVLLMVSGDINTKAISAGPEGRVYIADSSMFIAAGGCDCNEGDNFNPELVFALDPVATGGSITIDGTVTGGSLQAAAGGDFTSGAINVGGQTWVRSGGAVAITSIDAGSRVDIGATGNVGVGAIDAGTGIDIYSELGSIALAGLTAGSNIFLDAGGDISFDDASAGDSMEFEAGGSLTGGNLTAGRQITGQIHGALHLGNLSAGLINPAGPTDKGFSIGLGSATSILVGDVWGAEGIGFVSSGTLTAGTLTAGSDVGLLVTGDMIVDAISAGTNGRIYLADSSMFAAAGGANDFHPELVFGAEPVRTSGSITVNGAISGGSLQAKAGNNFTSGAIGVGSLASIDAGGNVLLAGVDAGGDLRIVVGGIVSADNLAVGESIDIDAGDAVTALNLTAGDTIAVISGGAISLGNLSAGLIDPSTAEGAEYNIGLNAHGTLTTGTLAAFNSIGLAATGNMSTGSIDAGDIFLALGGGGMSFGPLTAGGPAYLANYSMMALGGEIAGSFDPQPVLDAAAVATNGSILFNGNIAAGSLVANAGTSFTASDLNIDGLMLIQAGTSISTGGINAGGATELSAGDVEHLTSGSILTGDITAGGSIALGAGQTIGAGNLIAGGAVTLLSGGAIDVGNVTAGAVPVLTFFQSFEGIPDYDIAINSGGAVTTGDLSASHDVLLAATGNLDTGAIDAGNAVIALSDGNMTLGQVSAIGLFYIGNVAIMESAGQIGSDFSIDALNLSETNASGGTVTIDGDVYAGSLSAFSDGNFTADDITTTAEAFVGSNGSIQLGDIDAGGYAAISAQGGSATVGTVTSDATIGISASTTIAAGALTAGSSVDLSAGTGITVTGAIDAGNIVNLTSTAGPISVQAIRADQFVDIETAGTLTGTTISAGDSISVWGGAGVTLTNLDAGIVSPYSSEGPVDYHIGIGSDHNVTLGNLHAAGGVDLAAGGNLLVNAIVSGGDVLAMIGGNAGFGAVTADGRFAITGFDMIAAAGGREDFDRQFVIDAIDAGTATHGGGSVNLTGPVSAYQVDALVGQNVTAGAIAASNRVLIDAGGTLTAGNITTGHAIELLADGAMITGNLSAGIVDPIAEVEQYSVGLRSRTSIQTGAIASAEFVGIASAGTILTGNIGAGGDVIALAGGNAQFGAITTNSEGTLLVAGFATLDSAGGYDNPDNALLLAAVDGGTAVATGGSVTLGGPVAAGRIDILAGTNFTSGDIASNDMLARAGGTAFLNGQWTNGKTSLWSNDIVIGAGGGISGDEIVLISTNATQTMVGGGLSGTGYLLDGTEFGRLSAPSLTVVGFSDATAAIDMLIGDLSLTGSEGAKQYAFVVMDPDLQNVGGRMRVVGDVIGTNFSSLNSLEFAAGLVEVDAVNATIALNGAGSQLGGVLDFVTANLHVAEASILDKLAADPNYANRDFELQTAPSVARPDGVVRANEIHVILGAGATISSAAVTTAATVPYTVFVQNTGTPNERAGFLASIADIITPEGMAPGSIDMVVNGQLVAEGGNLTGDKVRDALIGEGDSPNYTANSTINGCPVSGGACANVAPPPPPPTYDPGPPLASEFVLISAPTAEDLPFGNEETIEDNEEDGGADSATSPIVPPQPLFDTRPMDSDDETDEPISGGGNPALIGAGVNPT